MKYDIDKQQQVGPDTETGSKKAETHCFNQKQ